MADSLTRIGNDPRLLAELTASLRLADLLYFDLTESTQIVARSLADNGAPAWTAVLADHQTAGRGQHGRSWEDAAGASLMLSILLRPTAEAMPLLPIRAGLAVSRAIDALAGAHRAKLKWPNDIIVSDCKVGGVLCEGQIRGDQCAAIVGIGINVRPFDLAARAPADIPGAFLADLLGADIERIDLLRAIITELRAAPTPPELTPEELAEYESRDWLRGRMLREPVEGRARGIDANGHLLVEREGEITAIVAGRTRPA
jgi:BirA family biotin operon repressor/biotin-[acetyl-CoA-carboxylase] ligase